MSRPQHPRDERLLAVGGLLAGLGVAAGAFAAHGLRSHVTPDQLAVFHTGAEYQLVHGVAIVAVAGAMSHFDRARLRLACWLFVAGIVLFSGSLYLLVLTRHTWLGAVTPLGGVAFLAGWAMVVAGARPRHKHGHGAGPETPHGP